MYRKSATEDKKAQSDKFNFYYERYKNHLLSIKVSLVEVSLFHYLIPVPD